MAKSERLDWQTIQMRAIAFCNRWQKSGKTNEKSYAHGFVIEFLQVFGIDWLTTPGEMEHQMFDGYSDYIWFGKIIIEMKSRGADPGFKKAESQLRRYTQELSAEQQPVIWMACDFENIRLWNRSTGQVHDFKTNKLKKYKKHFAPIAGHGTDATIHRDKEGVNRVAAEKMARLHDELKKHGYSGEDLEIYLARLLFCLFANDTNIFDQDSFQTYIEGSTLGGGDLDARLTQLFQDLNEPIEERIPNSYLSDQIDSSHFKYINGGLFEKPIRRAKFDKKMRQELLDCLEFDWSQISPAIFGSMFQGVMDRDQRREIGAHYTSEENILKLINPLFMDDLRAEFNKAKKKGHKALSNFHEKIASLKFLDPACGCGNFLIIAYKELRQLEHQILKEQWRIEGNNRQLLNLETHFKVTVEQFYGIEILPWPCQIAKTGMWLMDHMMNVEASEEFGQYFARIPLTKGAEIVNANAHRMDWESLVPKSELSYILGNPPFVGGMMMSRGQKTEISDVFGDIKGVGELDYVTAWYKKAADMMKGTNIKTAFVSTNSVTQGMQASTLWEPLFKAGITINFAYQTFKWSNEARGQAAVHCVILGISCVSESNKYIFEGDERREVTQINSYLVDGPIVFIKSRSKPLSKVLPMRFGSMPRDGGGFILNDEERRYLLKNEPLAKQWVKHYIGAEEFINDKSRWCLWLVGANPSELKKCPMVMERVESVRQFRANSKAEATRKFASTPTLFCQIAQPKTHYLIVPSVSSENRPYVPIGFLDKNTIASNATQIIPGANLYHFGILTSNVHNAWMRAVCGRLEMRYRYSKDIVYNNFPWPDVTDKQIAEIEKLAQGILDARAKFPDSTLADLYDPLAMPPELTKAHNALDRAVVKLYGFASDADEPTIVAALMEKYQELAKVAK